LQLKIEAATESFAEREPPRTVQSAAERRMNDDVRAAILVKKPLGDDLLLRRHRAQRNFRHREIFNDLFRGALGEPNIIHQPTHRGTINLGSPGAFDTGIADALVRIFVLLQSRGDFSTQSRD
jgi:hypothetical protein